MRKKLLKVGRRLLDCVVGLLAGTGSREKAGAGWAHVRDVADRMSPWGIAPFCGGTKALAWRWWRIFSVKVAKRFSK